MVTDPLERLKLRDAGFDPDELDAVSEVSPAPPQQQTATPAVSSVPKTGMIRSLFSNLAQDFPETVVALTGGGEGAALGSLAGPIGSVGGGILGTILSGIAAHKAKDAILREYAPGVKASLDAEREVTNREHPVISKIGSVLSALPLMKPSIGGLKSASELITKPLSFVVPSAENVGNALNVGIGAANPLINSAANNINPTNVLGSIRDLPGNMLADIKNDPKSALIESLGGLLNQPTALGSKLTGLQPHPITPKVGTGLIDQVRNSEPVAQVKEPLLINDKPRFVDTSGNIAPTVDALNPSLTQVNEQLKAAPEMPEVTALKAAQAEHTLAQQKVSDETARLKAQTENLVSLVGEKPGEVTNQEPLPEPPPVKPIPPPPEIPNGEVKQPINVPTELLQAEQSNPEKIISGLEAQNIPTQRTTAWADFWKKFGSERGVDVKNDGRVFDTNGKEISGQAFLKERLNKINPNKAQLDTDAHELLHVFYPDMLETGGSKAKAFESRANRVISENPEYQSWAAERNSRGVISNVNEYLMQLSGEDSVRRLLNSDQTGAVKNWMKDFWSYQKTKFNKATPEDFARVISNKLINDPSYNETKGVGNSNVKLDEKKSEPIELNPENKVKVEEPVIPKEPVLPNNSIPLNHLQEESRFGSKVNFTDKIQDTKSSKPPIEESPQRFGRIGLVDQISRNKNPMGRDLATAATDYYDKKTSIQGELAGKALENISKAAKLNISDVATSGNLARYASQNSPLLESTYNKMDRVRNGETVKFSPEEARIRNEAQSVFKKAREMQMSRPSMRKVSGFNETYLSDMFKTGVIEEINKDRSAPQAQKYMKDIVDYWEKKLMDKGTKEPRKLAEDNLEKLLNAFKSGSTDIASQYGPLDKAEGLGLPKSVRETHLPTIIQRYSDRAARRFAYEDTMKSPKVVKALNTLGGDDKVKTLMGDILGTTRKSKTAEKFTAVEGIARSGNLGPLTGLKDLVTTPALALQHQANPVRAAVDGVKAIIHLNEGIADGIKNGRIKHSINTLEWEDQIGLARKVSNILSDVQGRNFFERMARGFASSLGKITALGYHQEYLSGKLSKQGREFFDQFGRVVDWKKPSLSPEAISTLQGRFVDSVQGSYDYRNLPVSTKEGFLSPFLSLSRWNIEKMNNYYRHVGVPLSKGNITPFLMSTLGMVLGGTAITKLVETITGRKDKAPTVGELQTAADDGKNIALPLAYKLAGLAAFAGTVGLAGDLAKSTMDRMYAKTKPKLFNNMLLDAASNVEEMVTNLGDAITTDGFSPELIVNFVGQALSDNLQAARLVMNQINPESKDLIEKSNKYRDLRSFNLLEGNDVSDLFDSDYQHKFKGQTSIDYKNEQDIGKAAEMLPELLKKAMDDAKGNPDQLKKNLEKLKKNSYQTFPNIDTMPPTFLRYLTFLEKSQGKAEAQRRLQDYFERNMKNEIKSDLVPSL